MPGRCHLAAFRGARCGPWFDETPRDCATPILDAISGMVGDEGPGRLSCNAKVNRYLGWSREGGADARLVLGGAPVRRRGRHRASWFRRQGAARDVVPAWRSRGHVQPGWDRSTVAGRTERQFPRRRHASVVAASLASLDPHAPRAAPDQILRRLTADHAAMADKSFWVIHPVASAGQGSLVGPLGFEPRTKGFKFAHLSMLLGLCLHPRTRGRELRGD